MPAITHGLDFAPLAAWAADRVPGACFWTVSGAHLYGFQSVDSDVDLRGCFLAPIRELIGLRGHTETVEPKDVVNGLEVEAVSHEAGKYLRLLVKHNGYVLEQIFSPLVVAGQEFLDRLRPIAAKFVTKNCYHHYRGFIQTQRKLLEKEEPKKAKSLLYAYRVLLTGIHLLETGEVQAHLPTLNERSQLPFIPELIERKRAAEVGRLPDLDYAFHAAELTRLEAKLDAAFTASRLPETGPLDELNEFLVNERLGEPGA
jgi:predicted nucleotidyltransferase